MTGWPVLGVLLLVAGVPLACIAFALLAIELGRQRAVRSLVALTLAALAAAIAAMTLLMKPW